MTAGAGGAVYRGMSTTPDGKQKPDMTSRAEAEKLARQEREAAALRENLRKRKAQARARQDTADSEKK